MTDYVKSTNFASKDSLLSGNPLKLVKGTELDTEFNNIATSVGTKADTSQVATDISDAITAALTTFLAAAYPVGSIYVNATDNTNPATLLGFGTWTAFGTGKVLIGQDTGDTSFDTLEETGGSKDAIVVSHTHSVGTASLTGQFPTASNSGTSAYSGVFSRGTSFANNGADPQTNWEVVMDASHSHTLSTTGSSGTNANLQPYVVVKMWKRTA